MLSKIFLIVGDSWYDHNRYFTNKLAEAMQRQGFEIKIYDGKNASENLFVSIANFCPDLTCSFNYCISPDQKEFWWDKWPIPHYFMMGDPPFYSPQLFDSTNLIISSVDRNDCAAMREIGFKKTFFWPYGVDKDLAPEENQDRPYDVVFIGTCHDYENIHLDWKQRLSKPLQKVVEDAIDIVFSDDTIPLDKALLTTWQAAKKDLLPRELLALNDCYRYLDRYTRGKDRIELIRSIQHAQVHVFGALAGKDTDPLGRFGWSDFLKGASNVTVHPEVSYAESINILKRSKFVLNSSPFFRDGGHERIFIALACGCLPVSSESKYLREQFCADKEILFYQAAHRGNVNEEINEYLNHEHKRAKAAAQGRTKVMLYHTWDHRVQTLQEILPSFYNKLK